MEPKFNNEIIIISSSSISIFTNNYYTRPVKVKVKSSRYRPGVAQRVPGGLGSQIFMTFGT